MITWVIYDISVNKVRNRVSKMCKEYGLYRVQKSAFAGNINRNEADELLLKIKELVPAKGNSVYLFPLCDADFEKFKIVGLPFDMEMIADKLRNVFV